MKYSSQMRIVTLVVFLLALACPIRAQRMNFPLDRNEVLGRLASGESPSYIGHIVKTHGLDFVPDNDYLTLIKVAGGDGVLSQRLSGSYDARLSSGIGQPQAP